MHHPTADQEQRGERPAFGVSARQEGLRGASGAQPAGEGGVRASTQ